MKNYLLLLLIFFTTLLFCQKTFTGKIVDIKNQPISFADVIATNSSDNKIITGVSTDDKGNFELNLQTQEKNYNLICLL